MTKTEAKLIHDEMTEAMQIINGVNPNVPASSLVKSMLARLAKLGDPEMAENFRLILDAIGQRIDRVRSAVALEIEPKRTK